MTSVYLNNALTAICLELMDEWGLSLDQIKCLAADIPGECENLNEQAYERQQAELMESGGVDDSAVRRQIVEAGRGHLLTGGR